MAGPQDLMAPDAFPGDSFQDQAVDAAEYAQEAMNRIAAQYRFAGLVAGIKGPNDTDDDVEAARDAVLEAISQFFTTEASVHRQEIDRLHNAYRAEEAELERILLRHPDFYAVQRVRDQMLPMGHPSDQGPSFMEYIGTAEANDRFEEALSGLETDVITRDRLRAQMARAQQIGQIETARRAQARQDFINFWTGLWGKVRDYYNEKMALIREGRYLYAAATIVVDGIEVFHADIVIAIITAAIIAITGGVTAVMAPIIASAVAAALRVVRVGAGVLRRSADEMRHGAAATVFSIQLRVVDPDVQGLPVARPQSHYERQVDVSRDLRDDEKLLLNEENQGSMQPTDDAGDEGSIAAGRMSQRDRDYDEIMESLSPETVRRAAAEGTDDLAIEARQEVMQAYEAKFGNTNIMSGMSTLRPVRIVKFPPPDRLYTWRNENAIDPDTGRDRWGYGNFFDPGNGSATPDELGINSVGRTQAELDVSDRQGIAFEGYGAPIQDTWSVNGAGARDTTGGVPQWHIANDYKPEPDDLVSNGTNWRDLPGNSDWVDAERQGRLVYETRGTDTRPAWYLDGDPIADNGDPR